MSPVDPHADTPPQGSPTVRVPEPVWRVLDGGPPARTPQAAAELWARSLPLGESSGLRGVRVHSPGLSSVWVHLRLTWVADTEPGSSYHLPTIGGLR